MSWDAHRYHVMHRIDIAVTHVDPDRLQGEAELLPWDLDDDGRLQAAGEQRQVTVRGGVTWWRVGGEGARGDGTGLEATGTLIWNTEYKKMFRYHQILLFHCFSLSPVTANMTTCRDDERQGWDRCRLWNLPTTGKPLFVWRLQLVAKASRSSRLLWRWVLGPCAVATNPDPPKVWHDHLSCRYWKV